MKDAPSTVEPRRVRTKGSLARSLRGNRTALRLSAFAALSIALWFYYVKRKSPERIMDFPSHGNVMGIRDGQIYIHDSPNIWSIDAKSPSAKKLFWDYSTDLPKSADLFFARISMEAQGIQLIIPYTKLVSRGSGGYSMDHVVTTVVSLSEMKGATPVRSSSRKWMLSAKGYGSAAARTEIIEYPGGNAARVGSNIYWIERWEWSGIPKQLLPHGDGNKLFNFVYPPCSHLVVKTPEGISSFTGVLVDSELKSGSDRIYWIEQTSSVQGNVLCSLKPDEQQATRVPGYGGKLPPEECAGNLYWIETRERPSPASLPLLDCTLRRSPSRSWAPVTLKSWVAAGSKTQYAGQLTVAGQHIYYVVPEGSGPEANGKLEKTPTCVYEVTAGSQGIKRLFAMPPESNFVGIDGDYCYYSVAESREKWWDWSASGLMPEVVRVLFRRSLVR